MTKSKFPTEPGWYWYRYSSKEKWAPWPVEMHNGEPHVGATRIISFGGGRGEWGDRIPEPKEPLPLPRRFRCQNENGEDGVGVEFETGVYVAWPLSTVNYCSISFFVDQCGHTVTEWIDGR